MTLGTERTSEIRAAVAARMQAIVGSDPLPLYEMVRYHLGFVDLLGRPGPGGAGKALRPIFCCLACEAVCGDWRLALAAAAALELTHNFSLVHDDIEDGDLERRHRPTVWARWGLAQGINAGDALWAFAWQALAGAVADGVPATATVRCLERLATHCRAMIEGQYLDLALEGSAETDLDRYLAIVQGKTAALLASAFELGAICGGADETLAAAFGRAGGELGIAFQMEDDIIGVWGDPSLTGKSAENDIRRRKLSLPVVCALQRLQGRELQQLQAIYRSVEPLDDAAIRQVMDLFEAAEARDLAEQLARDHAQAARAALAALDLRNEAGGELLRLADSLSGRRQ